MGRASSQAKRFGRGAVLVLVALASGAGGERVEKPNFLLHFVDDLGYGDLGVTGHPSADTPHIDALAMKGRRLASWYSGYPVCTASRTALLTGRHPTRVGMPGVINSLGIEGLPLSEVTIADRLRDLGYRTLTVGSGTRASDPIIFRKPAGLTHFTGFHTRLTTGSDLPTRANAGPLLQNHAPKALAIVRAASL